ncbi:MAG: methyltransferase [Gemmatimonadota bacterium]|nr:methyltransferase [Gemmatimonadota bacterium]
MEASQSFEYRDKHFGDTEGIVVATSENVFVPTSTTTLLLAAVRKSVNPNWTSALDLGCGSGVVAVVLKKLILPDAAVSASDISEEAVALTRQNAGRHGLAIECRAGSLFEPWSGRRFDVIVDDVAGMSEPVARLSRWYPPQIRSDAGESGTRWIVPILEQAPRHLTIGGEIFFPVLTLSHEAEILRAAESSFARVELITEQWYPLSGELLNHWAVVEDLMARGMVTLQKRGSRWLWATKIYRATNPA